MVYKNKIFLFFASFTHTVNRSCKDNQVKESSSYLTTIVKHHFKQNSHTVELTSLQVYLILSVHDNHAI